MSHFALLSAVRAGGRSVMAATARGACLGLLLLAGAAYGQGGPPMVTDDPDTPGDGHWEINFGQLGNRGSDGWLLALFDADVNYGWGDRIQLKIDTPYNAVQNGGGGGADWAYGLGTTQLGVKWRFFEDESSGLKISTYPQASVNLDSHSAGRGLASPSHSFLLPLESSFPLPALDLDMDVEVGRNLVQDGDSEWIAGVIVARKLGADSELMLEGRIRSSAAGTARLANLGTHWALGANTALLAAVGHESGSAPGRSSALYYLGVQWTH